MLHPPSLVEQAKEATGLDDLGEDGWQEGLERFCEAATEEARLNELGVHIVAGELVGYLTNRLGIVDHARGNPEISRQDITAPVFIVGQARTGTTILHELLAQDPAHRVPQSWEVDHPLPPPATATYATDPRIEEVESRMAGTEILIPGFRSMHPIGARLPQECVRITGSSFRSMIFPTQYRVPSYGRWLLDEADMAPAYRWHRAYLQHLQSEHRAERWVLKSPGHIWCLESLMAEYPDALLVQTHRDPLKIIASVSSLIALLRKLACDDPSMPEAAEEFAGYILEGLDRSVVARKEEVVPGDRVVDVHFAEFMADPFRVMREVYARMARELTPETEEKMRSFHQANPADKHGAHRYSFADTGLDPGPLRERARAYQEYFDVPSEPL